MKYFLIGLVRFYQVFLSPLFPSSCRFHPTCSEYAIEAIKTHGPFKGGILSVRRILKCRPFGPCGFDPVP
ncbi:MAG: membrane protein insertion efficiency factor YidD [Syntrophaceae bacterium]|nr:membrane protein insertion efficiency factor YidD [Syntrophaceae bacterium]